MVGTRAQGIETMNWLGKVFVVLILIMSLVFMGLAMAVYATHKNWKDIIEGPNGLAAQLQQAQTENQKLTDQHNRKVEELDAEILAAEQQVRKLESERVALIARNAEMQAERDQLVQERREATAAVAATQANNDKLAADAATLRQQIRDEQQARDTAFNATLAATEELHQLRNEYESALERSQDLTRRNAGMEHIMRAEGLDPAADPSGVVPTVDGIVSQIRRIAGGQLAEVTIGTDDGLKEGNKLHVYRGSRYLGRLEVVETSPDKAVGRVERAYQQGAIQEGDRVATRLTTN
jgi:hypothetical protein